MVKDKSIIFVVDYLKKKYGDEKIIINDYWDADLLAIGITEITKTYLVYIATHNIDKGVYYVALEDPPKDDDFPYTPAGEFENVTLEELEVLVVKHLRMNIKN